MILIAYASKFNNNFLSFIMQQVRNLFKLARSKAPCILFIDEIDAVGSSRTSQHKEYSNTVNELLVQMDGLAKTDDLVFLLAASNLPWYAGYDIVLIFGGAIV